MKLRRVFSAAVFFLFLFPCACAPQENPSGTEQEGQGNAGGDSVLRFTAEEEKIAVFQEGGSSLFQKRSGRNGDPFDCVFLPENVRFGEGAMQLFLTKTQDGFGGSEYRSRSYFSYGFYSVSMKAAKASGVISSFFTYTGNPWDEIDIEFLGKNTEEIQFNYYTKGRGGHEFVYSLGFDGADDFHEYAFLWLPQSITWYVDGKAVHTVQEDIPSAPTQIMMNVWNCKGNDGWSGKFDENLLPVCANYQWIGYAPAEGNK